MKGTLSQGVLPGLLRDLYLGRKTGLLYVTHGEERRGVRFVKGHIVRADRNRSEEHLGETLVRLGRLQHADLERGSELALRGGRRVGAALVELGLLDQPQLEEPIHGALCVRFGFDDRYFVIGPVIQEIIRPLLNRASHLASGGHDPAMCERHLLTDLLVRPASGAKFGGDQ